METSASRPSVVMVLLFLSVALNIFLYWRLSTLSPDKEPISIDVFEPVATGTAKNTRKANNDIGELGISIEDLQVLFNAGIYDQALSGLALIAPREALALKTRWLATCTRWLLEDAESPSIGEFIDEGLRQFPRDIDFRQLQAERLLVEGKLLEAVDLIYELLNESDRNMQGIFAARLQTLFSDEVKKLSEQQAWQPLVDFSQRLLWHEPTHPPYVLVHSRALAKLQQYSQARAGLAPIVVDEYYGAQAKALIEEIDRLALGKAEIALQAVGTHHVVNAKLNERYSVNLMLDTGATYSVVDQAFFLAQNIYPNPKFLRTAKINTAGGPVTANVYRIASMQLDDYIVRDIEIVVMPIDTAGSSKGLLGMNFLRRFEFAIDQQRNVMLLSPR